MAIAAFARARADENNKTTAYYVAALASDVTVKYVKQWVRRWRLDDGVLDPTNWGKSRRVPTYFTDENIRKKSLAWWQARKPRKGALTN